MQSLASLQVPSADVRRKQAARFTRCGLPADAAAAAALLTGPAAGRGAADGPLPAPVEHDSGAPVLSRLRVFLPLVEPNVLAWMRGVAHMMGQAPRPTGAEDGILTATWASPAAHADATRRMYDWYLTHHDAVRRIADYNMAIDSWHSPLLLAPIRHVYADGSRTRAAWMAAEGTARVFGGRLALATALRAWAPGHPWSDPAGWWPNDAVALRSLAAVARDHLAAQGIAAEHDWSLAYPWAEDWADLVLPGTDLHGTLSAWALREHTTRPRPDQFPDAVADYVQALDVFVGVDPFARLGVDPSSLEGREEVADAEQDVRDWLLTPVRDIGAQAQRIALLTVAVADPETAPASNPEALLADYAAEVTSHGVATGGRVLQRWETAALLATLRAALGSPQVGDLYGVREVLADGFATEEPMGPAGDWFWVTLAEGMLVALLAGHVRVDPENPEPLATLVEGLATEGGAPVAVAYAQAAQDGEAPDNLFTPDRIDQIVAGVVDRRLPAEGAPGRAPWPGR